MPAVTMPAHRKATFLVDYEEKVFEDVKAEPGEKALVTFHTVAFEGSIGLVNMLQATRLLRKGFETSSCSTARASRWACSAAFRSSATRRSPATWTSTTSSSSSWPKAARSTPAASRCRRCTATAKAALIAGIRPINPLDVLDIILLHRKDKRLHPQHLDALSRRDEGERHADSPRSSAPPRCRSRPTSRRRRAHSTRCCAPSTRRPARARELVVFPETVVPYYPYFSFVLPPVPAGREHTAAVRTGGGRAGAGDRGGVAAALRAREAWWSRSASTSATTARSTTRSSCSMPTARSC